jgi:hypothetical protein
MPGNATDPYANTTTYCSGNSDSGLTHGIWLPRGFKWVDRSGELSPGVLRQNKLWAMSFWIV